MHRKVTLILIGAVIGFLVGRIIPPAKPANWNKLQVGMHYSRVYELVPNLSDSMRGVKGVDTCTAEFGNSYWQLLVHYDNNGNITSIRKELH